VTRGLIDENQPAARPEEASPASQCHRHVLTRKQIQHIRADQTIERVGRERWITGIGTGETVVRVTPSIESPSGAFQHLLRDIEAFISTFRISSNDLGERKSRPYAQFQHILPIVYSGALERYAAGL
jgi:hypothetical protein